METAPHAQEWKQKSNMWLHAQAERVKRINVCVCVRITYSDHACTALS